MQQGLQNRTRSGKGKGRTILQEEALLREALRKRLYTRVYEGAGVGGIGVSKEMLARTLGDFVQLGALIDCVGPLGRLSESSPWHWSLG